MDSKTYQLLERPYKEFLLHDDIWFDQILSIFSISTKILVHRFINQHGVSPLESAPAEVWKDDFLKKVDVLRLDFNLTSSVIDSSWYPRLFEHRPLVSQDTTFWLSQFMRTREEGDFGTKYKNAITADSNSLYPILNSSNLNYFP